MKDSIQKLNSSNTFIEGVTISVIRKTIENLWVEKVLI